ncbi:MAG TPA: DUF4235 domain-containing protein [Streptosporangiaceae bacterium]|nr:DUF4235 domain-containing protein [Streptosporangiaceae bacterium]
MTDKGAKSGRRALGGAFASLADLAADHYARRAITSGWKRVTGKEPPTDPTNPKVALGEALSWAIITGIVVEAARMLTARYATRGVRRALAKETEE